MDIRNEIIEKVVKQKSIYKNKKKIYVLCHTYDHEPRPVIIKTTMNYNTMDLLLAYIQYKAAETLEEYDFDQVVIGELLSKYFECEVLEQFNGSYYEMDLYKNWEAWTGVADKVDAIPHFYNEDLIGDIKDLVDKSILN